MEKVWTSCFFRIEDFLGNFLGNAKKKPDSYVAGVTEKLEGRREGRREGEREKVFGLN
jgi:hypothetical protein